MADQSSSLAVEPTPDGPAAVPPSGTPELRTLLNLAVAALVVTTLFVAQNVLLPIILAVLLSFVLSPMVTALGRIGLSRSLSVLATVIMAFGVIALGGVLLARQATTLAADAPHYATAIQEKFGRLEVVTSARLAMVTGIFDHVGDRNLPARSAAVPSRPTDRSALAAAAAAARGEPIPVEIARTRTSPLAEIRSILSPILEPLEMTVIVLVIAIFVLMEREDLRDRFIRLVGSSDLHRTTSAMDDAGHRLSRYFLSQLAVNSTFGLVIGLGLWLLDVPSPALWGVLAGLLRFVPYIGPVLAAAPPIVLAAAVNPGWWRSGEVALLFAAVEPLTGYAIEPLLYGHSTGLAPVSVVVAAVFWTWMWGPIGLILSTPLTLCLVVVGRHVKELEFLDVLLGDRPALAPVENLYQRILADSPDEALEKADALLADHTLLDYYDDVVLPALKLAAQDEARGRIPAERASRMTSSLLDVIAELSDHEEQPIEHPAADGEAAVAPPSSMQRPSRPGCVACVSGHGPFDDAVSGMLAQLLERVGVKARQVKHADVSRDRIPQFDAAGTDVLALSYLDTGGSAARLRYLIRRLRHHAPGVRIIVGLWPAGEEGGVDAARRQSVGADAYVGSLREALAAVRESINQPLRGGVGSEDPTLRTRT